MFTAKITDVKKNKVDCDIAVEVSKDGQVFDTFTVPHVNPPESVKAFILQRVKLYEAIDAFDASTLKGDVNLDAEIPKTDEQIAMETKAKLTDLKQRLDVKMIDQETYDAAVAEITGN